MKGRLKHISLFLLLLGFFTGYGQISPGDLTKAHAKLEGMSNCTVCHDLGKKVSNKKCLKCHDEIQALLNQKKGYHSNYKVVGQDCFKCHSEHFGRNYNMVRFDEVKFNHDQTSYSLEGKHKVVDCRKCHTPDNIQDVEIRKRKNTYLGLKEKCLSCHDDYHQKTLSDNCASCHGMEAFSPASKFNHNRADYKLEGKHNDVDCKKCHKISQRNGREFQSFSDISFQDCKNCHSDPHYQRIKGKCVTCHVETSFSTFTGRGRFNHNTTDFTLRGNHKKIDCFTCHDKNRSAQAIFGDKKNVDEEHCVSCHSDVHKDKFGNECAKCHTENGFLQLNSMNFFNHALTDYTLEGKHIGVDCKQCHLNRYIDPINFSACRNCHMDYHKSEFKRNGASPDCNQCHSLEHKFDYSLYTLEQHQTSSFPLEGAHVATPCYACHVSEDRWSFKNSGSNCVDCHQDLHQEYISKKYYPDKKCTNCHSNEIWSQVHFNHNLTSWPLEGRHKEVACRECHFDDSDINGTFNQKFVNLESKCSICHENIHGDSYVIKGETDCKRCHSPENWFPKQFDHSTAAFPLEGRHTDLKCTECHKVDIVDGKRIIKFKIEKFECVDCHF